MGTDNTNSITFMGIFKSYISPIYEKIELKPIFIDPSYIKGLKYVSPYCTQLIMTNGFYNVRGSLKSTVERLNRHGVSQTLYYMMEI